MGMEKSLEKHQALVGLAVVPLQVVLAVVRFQVAEPSQVVGPFQEESLEALLAGIAASVAWLVDFLENLVICQVVASAWIVLAAWVLQMAGLAAVPAVPAFATYPEAAASVAAATDPAGMAAASIAAA